MKNKSKQKRKRKIFKFYNEKNEFTILDKIADIPSVEGFKTVGIYMLMGFMITFAMAIGSVGNASMGAVSNSNTISQNAVLFGFGVFMYTIMAFSGIVALICYDRNASKYKEPGIKIAKIVIVIFLVSAFKDTKIVGVFKDILL